MAVYAGNGIPELQVEKLIYFAMSVFWRAGAHVWRRNGQELHIELGPFLEPTRRFLLGEDRFPARTGLAIRVSGLSKMLETAHLPESQRENGYHAHGFSIPGLAFLLTTGQLVPNAFLQSATAPSPERFVAICPAADVEDLLNMAKAARRSRPISGRLGG
jgi:hypothetical protein